jgi:hypothetical protein
MKNQRLTFDSAAFRNKFHYSGSDLGAVLHAGGDARFVVWAPLADEVSVIFYRASLGGHRAAGQYPMKRGRAGHLACPRSGRVARRVLRLPGAPWRSDVSETVDTYAPRGGRRTACARWWWI